MQNKRNNATLSGLVQREADRLVNLGIRTLCNQALACWQASRTGEILPDSECYIDPDSVPDDCEPAQAFIVDDTCARRLEADGEVVVEWGALRVWFRQCGGQRCSMDRVFTRWAAECLLARREVSEEEAKVCETL
jgi:hypothetical protein